MNKKFALVLAPVFWPSLPPLSLIHLGSFLVQNRYKEVALLDLNNRFFNLAQGPLKKAWQISCNRYLEDNIFEILNKDFSGYLSQAIDEILQYQTIGFSVYRSNINTTLILVKLLKQKRKEIKIVLGGPEITRIYFKNKANFPKDLMEIADLLVAGEGEKPLLAFLQGRLKDKNVVCFDELSNLDKFKTIDAYKKLDLNTYPKKQSISLFSARGCRKKCAFCSERLLYKKVRRQSVDNVIAQIDYHRSRQGIKNFIFHDSMLNENLEYLENLCDKIIERFGKINWEAQVAVRPDMPGRLMSKIKQSGCYNLFIGLESGSDKTLKKMRKGFTAALAREFFYRLKEADIWFGVSIIIGFPGETDKQRQNTLDFLIQNKDIIPKIEQVNPFVYYEGTKIEKESDYRFNKETLKKTNDFIESLRKNGFKMTNAFLNNLVEK